MLKKNLEILNKRFPITFRKIAGAKTIEEAETIEESKKFGVSETIDCGLKINKNGSFKFNFNSNEISPYGNQYSNIIIEKWIDSLNLKKDSCCVVTGVGNGKHIKELLKRLKNDSILIVGEANLNFLKSLFSTLDCSDWLSDERLFLVTGEINESSFAEFGISSELVFKSHAEACVFGPLFMLDEAYYDNFLCKFVHSFDLYKRNQNTGVGDSALWQSNTFDNISVLLNAPDIAALKNAFEDIPVVLVSAGPSLDEAIPFLKEAQKNALIVSMNSSYRKLCNNNIRSDITLAADPRPTTFAGFKNQPRNDTVLICPSFVHPDVVKFFEGSIFSWQTSSNMFAKIKKELGLPKGTSILEAGTIAACIGDLVRIWGGKTICLVGQDLAVSSSGKTHTSDSFYRERDDLFMDVSNCRKVAGNTEKEVYVEEKLFAYLKAFEVLPKRLPEISFINTARLGAKIKGIPYLDYDEALGRIKSKKEIRAKEILYKALEFNKKITKKDLKKTLKPTLKFAEELLKLCLKVVIHSELIDEKLQHSCYHNDKEIKKQYAYADEINALIDSNEEEFQMLFDGKTKFSLTLYKRNFSEKVNSSQSMQEHWKAILHNREFYWALIEGAKFLTVKIKNLIKPGTEIAK